MLRCYAPRNNVIKTAQKITEPFFLWGCYFIHERDHTYRRCSGTDRPL
jgi:hypothetical protein